MYNNTEENKNRASKIAHLKGPCQNPTTQVSQSPHRLVCDPQNLHVGRREPTPTLASNFHVQVLSTNN